MTYFGGLRSRGEPTQMIAAYKGGVKLEVELIGLEEWGNRKGKIAPFLPYITQPDGTIMLETTVIMKHLAEVGGKFVIDEKTEELCKIANDAPMQTADPVFNLPDGGGGRGKAGDAGYDEWFDATVEVAKLYVAKLGDQPFFAGETPT